jgi:hypothetical protein
MVNQQEFHRCLLRRNRFGRFREDLHAIGNRRCAQEKQSERDARVSRLEILPGDVTVQEGQRVNFTAVAFDSSNNTVGGVKIRWSARDEGRSRGVFINQRGDFAARAEGNYRVTAEAAGQRKVVNVTVIEGIRKRPGDDVPIEVKTKSSRDLPPQA